MDIRELLRSQGYSDADIEQMGTLLNDPRFGKAFETVQSSARDARDAEWTKLRDETWTTNLSKAEQEAQKARIEAANLREQLAIAKDYGYLGDPEAERRAKEAEERAKQTQNQNNQPGFNANDPQFRDFAGRFAMGQGRAMAVYTDISNAHQRLFGEPLEGFESLYDDYSKMTPQQRENTSIRDVWERKYNVQAKRQEIETKRQADHDEQVRKEAIQKYIMDNPNAANPNPMLQGPRLSNNPFLPRTQAGQGGEAPKQPWERGTSQQLATERRQRAMQSELKSMVQ